MAVLVPALLLIGALLVPAVQAAKPQDVIVVLDSSTTSSGPPDRAVASVLAANGETRSVAPTHVYRSALSGFSASLTSTQQAVLAIDPRVLVIVPDEPIEIADDPGASPTPVPSPTPTPSTTPGPSPTPSPRPPLPTPGPNHQIVPTGVERIGRPALTGARLNGASEPTDIDIAIVDTGVAKHPDLNVVGGVDCTGSRIGWLDAEGHGTHVAGTAAAKDNDFGVVGVAPGARVWSVKVLNKRGYGRASWLLCGIDWITAQRDGDKPLIEVANMSLRFHGVKRRADDGNCGLTDHDAIHQAICTSTAHGTIYVAAAGNEGRNALAFRPAAYDEVITVSALSDFDGMAGGHGVRTDTCLPEMAGDRDDVLASFSDYGRDIDIMAPGRCIWSTYKGDSYRPMSGTSMATPHVTGAVALYRVAHPDWSFDEVRAALIACGTTDWRRASDRDRFHEPLLNISRLC